MKKTLIALAALGAFSAAAFAEDGSSGESKYTSDPFANTETTVSPANADPENPILLPKKSLDDEDRRVDEKNGSRG
jgi:nucleoside-specific outer membrane channel protein Tsx